MARTYHVDIAQYAAKSDRKWIDNLLSHHTVPGVAGGTQGVARRIGIDGIHHISLIRRLTREAGFATAGAVSIARRLLATDSAHVSLMPGLELEFDRPRFERDVDQLIAEGVEAVQPPRRGRPPGQSRTD